MVPAFNISIYTFSSSNVIVHFNVHNESVLPDVSCLIRPYKYNYLLHRKVHTVSTATMI